MPGRAARHPPASGFGVAGSEAATTRSSFVGAERSLAVCADPDDKEAARPGCPLCNLTNGEILESLL